MIPVVAYKDDRTRIQMKVEFYKSSNGCAPGLFLRRRAVESLEGAKIEVK